MPELAPKERLQPALLDRLTDEEPQNAKESADKRVLSMTQLRESVRRDLAFLLNTTHLASVQDLADFPEAERSTINYGIPDLAGRPASTVDTSALARRLRRAILDFEPRLVPSSLKVQVAATTVPGEQHSPNALKFDIEADLFCLPLPIRLYLRTDLNLEDGEVHVTEAVAG